MTQSGIMHSLPAELVRCHSEGALATEESQDCLGTWDSSLELTDERAHWVLYFGELAIIASKTRSE